MISLSLSKKGISNLLLHSLLFYSPFPLEELLLKLQDLQSAVNTGKDSL